MHVQPDFSSSRTAFTRMIEKKTSEVCSFIELDNKRNRVEQEDEPSSSEDIPLGVIAKLRKKGKGSN